MMSISSTTQRTMDLVVSRRVFNACWLSASLSGSILQMLLLAQAWHVSQHALVPACLLSASMIGSLVGVRVRIASRVWGTSYLACVLLWLASPSLVSWHLPQGAMPPPLVSIVALAIVALVLGTSSASWLAQQRSWPSVGERTALVRSLVGLTVGLAIAWMLPAFAGLIALTCCIPLLALDFLPPRRAPLPMPGGVEASWVGRYWNTGRWPLQLDQRSLPKGWWWSYLVERTASSRWYLPLTLLASGVAVIVGSVWGAVPTPFAAGLAVTHALDKLAWLLAGQLVILPLGLLLLLAARSVIGFPHRLLPATWQARARALALVMSVGLAGSLIALGLPFLQAPWWLAVSLGSYTLAGAVWGILLPRLRPAFVTEVQAQRHLLLAQDSRLLDPVQLAHAGACEARFNRLVATVEGLLIAFLTPLVGWLIDASGGVDRVLVMVGLALLVGLTLATLACALASKQRQRRRTRVLVPGVARYAAHMARGRVLFAS